jgi:ribosomal protein L7/L12
MSSQQTNLFFLWFLRSVAVFLLCFQFLRLAERFWGLGRTPLHNINAGPRVAEDPAPRYLSTAEAVQDTELQGYVAQDMKIHAIKRYRELTGAGLKEAKDTIDTHMSEGCHALNNS